jgi:hypothetical protein
MNHGEFVCAHLREHHQFYKHFKSGSHPMFVPDPRKRKGKKNCKIKFSYKQEQEDREIQQRLIKVEL